jgi:hypothetical protein
MIVILRFKGNNLIVHPAISYWNMLTVINLFNYVYFTKFKNEMEYTQYIYIYSSDCIWN